MRRPIVQTAAGRRPGRGFTLVELLVVITIIAVLMGLLLPAVQAAREGGRRTVCQNNLYQLAFAAVRHDGQFAFVPGWRNAGPANGGFTSWPIVLLPFMERNDIHKIYANSAAASISVAIAFYQCPSTPADTPNAPLLAYAGNAGGGRNSWRGDGVMLDTSVSTGRMSCDDISGWDGTATTVILSEKCGPGTAASQLVQANWNAAPISTSGTITNFSNVNAMHSVFGLVGTTPPSKVINSTTAAQPGFYSQPSSQHPGGVVMAFCDGHTEFVKDSLASSVYAQLLSADDSVNSNAAYTTYRTWRQTYAILNDSDYK